LWSGNNWMGVSRKKKPKLTKRGTQRGWLTIPTKQKGIWILGHMRFRVQRASKKYASDITARRKKLGSAGKKSASSCAMEQFQKSRSQGGGAIGWRGS